MNRKVLLLLLLICTHLVHGQSSAYYPDGKKIPYKLTTINALKDSLGLDDVHSVFTPYGEVFYKKFTSTPVFILFNKTPDVSKIPIMLKKFDYLKYINSYSYYFDLKSAMNDGRLTEKYLLKNLGKPDNWENLQIDTTSSNVKDWRYRKRNLLMEMTDSLATKVDVINFRGIDTHGFSILNYKVTGESYSIGFDIILMNLFPSKKTIKYLYFTVVAKNPVDDIIGTKTVRGIGPISYGKPAEYTFADVFYSKSANSLTINSMKIQFMDGTFKTFSRSQIDAVTMVDWEEYGNRPIE